MKVLQQKGGMEPYQGEKKVEAEMRPVERRGQEC